MPQDAPPNALAWRLLFENAWRRRRLVLGSAGAIPAACVALGLALSPRFVSHSTLVLLLGPEYTVRVEAGAGPTANTAFDPDHILGTESAILGSDDLARDVLREIGVARLYPTLTDPPDGLHRLIRAVRDVPHTLMVWAGLARRRAPTPPLELAVPIFADHLDVEPAKTANVIALSFTHRDPALARRVLVVTERDYLARRRALYQQSRSGAMREKLAAARAALDAAERRLARFRATRALPDYATQLDILLHEQGDIAHELDAGQRNAAAAQARITSLGRELASLPPTVEEGTDTNFDGRVAALRDSLDGLHAKAAETLSRYRPDSPFARALDEQIAGRTHELAAQQDAAGTSAIHRARNPAEDTLNETLLATRGELRATEASLTTDRAEAADLSTRIAALDDNQRQLTQLVDERDVALDAVRSLAASLATQDSIEQVEARSLPSVRIAAAPSLPQKPRPIPLLLALAGAILGIGTASGLALLLHAFRRTLLAADEIELLGIDVLAEISRADRTMGEPAIRPLPA